MDRLERLMRQPQRGLAGVLSREIVRAKGNPIGDRSEASSHRAAIADQSS